jgi:hypothetical protein
VEGEKSVRWGGGGGKVLEALEQALENKLPGKITMFLYPARADAEKASKRDVENEKRLGYGLA